MRLKCCLLGLVLLASGMFLSMRAELTMGSVKGSRMAPGDIALTLDDFPPRSAPDGSNNADAVREDLKANGATAAIFVNGCLFQNMPLPGTSPICAGPGTESPALLQRWAEDSFNVANHSYSHQAYLYKNDIQILVDIKLNQWLLNPYQSDGIRLLRFPYLQGGAREIAAIEKHTDLTGVFPAGYKIDLNSIDVSRLRGPMDVDMGTRLIKPDGTQLLDHNGNGGGDTLCYAAGIAAAVCADLYVNSAQPSGIMLSHIGGDTIPGGANPWAVAFHHRLVQALIGKGSHLVPVDAVPGLLGNIRATSTRNVSPHFGAHDGDGPVVFGDIDGDGRVDVCKAFGQDIQCMLAGPTPNNPAKIAFHAPKSWYHAEWLHPQFALVDWDGDGKKDLLVATSQGMLVAHSTGAGFVTVGIWSTSLPLASLHFADLAKSGAIDAVSISGNQIVALRRNTTGFDPARTLVTLPAGIDWTDPKYASTLQVGDLNGDGLPDLIVRGPADVWVSLNQGGSFTSVTSWSRRLPDWQGWDKQYGTLSLVHADGNVWLGGGLPGGVILHRAETSKFGRYSYVNNTDYSSFPDWTPARYASQLAFANLAGGKNDWMIMVRAEGLYAAPIVRSMGLSTSDWE